MLKLGEKILNLVYPPKCTFCHSLLMDDEYADGRFICRECRDNISILDRNASSQSFENVRECISAFYYEGYIRDALHRYKFQGRQLYAVLFSEYMFKAFEQSGIQADIISWAPLSRKRLRSRGYDQAKLLAEEIAQKTGIESATLLKKTKNVKPQSQTGAYDERRKNISGAYSPACAEKIKNKRILLIDDIVTTGSTLSECAGVLKSAGADEIYALTVARRKN